MDFIGMWLMLQSAQISLNQLEHLEGQGSKNSTSSAGARGTDGTGSIGLTFGSTLITLIWQHMASQRCGHRWRPSTRAARGWSWRLRCVASIEENDLLSHVATRRRLNLPYPVTFITYIDLHFDLHTHAGKIMSNQEFSRLGELLGSEALDLDPSLHIIQMRGWWPTASTTTPARATTRLAGKNWQIAPYKHPKADGGFPYCCCIASNLFATNITMCLRGAFSIILWLSLT